MRVIAEERDSEDELESSPEPKVAKFLRLVQVVVMEANP